MRLEIIGAGALGLLLAGVLGQAAHQVHLWTRTEEQASLINRGGIELESTDGSRLTVHAGIRAAAMSSEGSPEMKEADWVILAVKQRHFTSELIKSLRLLKGHSVPVLCLQNGMGHLERLETALERGQIYAAVTTEGAKRKEANQVIRSLPGETLLGAPLGAEVSRMEGLAVILQKAGFNALVSKDIERDMHRKLLINAAINPLTAIWRIPNGELLATEERLAFMDRLIKEGTAVFEKSGIPYDSDIGEKIKAVCRTTAGNNSSMLADVLRGEETEIDYINGYIVRLAAKAGMEVPSHENVWRLVKGMQPSGK